ncbi:ParB/RepB/Spo0J family partition protein [Streptomyces sp. TLI_185]|uniref:ParB/RepB/Spo0J family partition protein n=1 Tax=Streptomyces sp. TLI_185 TaxID=2485151 RepID=UPI000F51575C|nr:ParB/RepB/Spo0J family partition protein [Streptomyces sp. TLI_185]RPF24755.1 ParB family chromosome partitioning protein [Streptomyces sp. TLI_185]
MSKADQLGAGRFGGGVRPVSARRQAVAAATGVPTEAIAPPTELPVQRVSLNPDNPRSSLGDLTDLAGSLKTHGQKQAITVMNRDAYIKANPQREADLEPDTTHVVVDGSSRLAAARDGGLATIKVMVSDDEGSTPEEILESALVANIHRQDLEELDEARALQRLLDISGSQRALAKRLHRSQGWISQRLALLNLTPELQARIGEEPIDLLRAVGNKPADQQEGVLEELKAERARKEGQARTSKGTPKPQAPETGELYSRETAPDTPAEPESNSAPEGADATQPPVHRPRSAQDEPSAIKSGDGMPSVPAQAATEGTTADEGEEQPKRFPYEKGWLVAELLIRKMPPAEFDTMLDTLIKYKEDQTVSSG